MNKKILLTTATTMIVTVLNAGGNILPVVAPLEPEPPKHQAVPVYIGAGVAGGRYLQNCKTGCHYEDGTYGLTLRVGYELGQYVGIEARYINTFLDKGRLFGQTLEHIGLFVKPMLPFDEDFNIYGLLGYGWTKTHTNGILNKAIDENGFSAGLGFEYDLSDKRADYDRNIYYPNGFDGQADQERGWGLFVDYQRLLIKSNVPDLDVISGGVTYDF